MSGVRLIRSLFHFLQGLILGYPPCCVLHFCYDSIKGIPSSVKRGITKGGYVPCKYCSYKNIIKKFPIKREQLKEYLDKGYWINGIIKPNNELELYAEVLLNE